MHSRARADAGQGRRLPYFESDSFAFRVARTLQMGLDERTSDVLPEPMNHLSGLNRSGCQMKPVKLPLSALTALVGLLSATLGAQGQVPGILRAPQGTSILIGSPLNIDVQASSASPLS